jgi:hypothetical protein
MELDGAGQELLAVPPRKFVESLQGASPMSLHQVLGKVILSRQGLRADVAPPISASAGWVSSSRILISQTSEDAAG